ncbi:EsV-1-35 [Ectocarpus siliculosus virus 1]|uniref:EsV-1-35 n=1 Tax=Ectocarpus siliculosus virus 1 (isolate New Zealand/Kaikoura/1988) TaxID=654926 RepID=Q8QKW2_ESV1K|nr:EsV-1-35 [Ectocarpus siliculosus virus 1]AAK14461.1 EsV-1-35 [Ectocarpus siliculosus virus 1]
MFGVSMFLFYVQTFLLVKMLPQCATWSNIMLCLLHRVVTDDSFRFSGTDHDYVDPQYQQPATHASE